MAAHVYAAARHSRDRYFLINLLFVYFLVSALHVQAQVVYSRQELLIIGREGREGCIFEPGVSSYNIPAELVRMTPWITFPAREQRKRRRRRKRRQKRGCRAGLRVRLGKNPHKPALPSLFVSNVRSLPNKIEELELIISRQKNIRDCCFIVFTETWLDSTIPGEAIELPGCSVYRADRTMVSGKSRGGGLCVYINNNWSTNVKIMDTHCSPDLEYLAVKCRPFYLPREFNIVITTVVYIPPDANTTIAMSYLLTAISKQQQAYQDGVLVVAGDFNQANLKTVLPKFYQYVDCPTRRKNTLDQVYSNIMHGYRTMPLPHLGQSDHISVLLIPSYRPLVNRIRPSIREIQVWPAGALEQLQDCFGTTDWVLFEENNIDVYTSTVLFYIKSCIDVVTTTRQVRVFSNNKPWINRKVCLLLRARNVAFHSGDALQYSEARAKLKRGIKDAKATYRRRTEHLFENSDSGREWQGLRQITGQSNKNSLPGSSDSLAEQLNQFFSRFEVDTGTSIIPAFTTDSAPLTSTIDRQPLLLQISDVRHTLCL